MGRRIGLLGGSFNPIHLAHLRAAEEIRERCRLDEVRFIPAAAPPHKPATDLAPAADRLHMVRLAIEGTQGFRASAMEIDRGGTSYSVDTIRQVLSEPDPAERLVFILGLDAFREIHTWKDHEAIFGACDLAVLPRPGSATRLGVEDFPVASRGCVCYDPLRDCFRHESGHTTTLFPISALDVSATEIRRRVREHRSIRFLVPAPVERYIHERQLYRPLSRRPTPL